MSDAMWEPQDVDRKVTLKGWAKQAESVDSSEQRDDAPEPERAPA